MRESDCQIRANAPSSTPGESCLCTLKSAGHTTFMDAVKHVGEQSIGRLLPRYALTPHAGPARSGHPHVRPAGRAG